MLLDKGFSSGDTQQSRYSVLASILDSSSAAVSSLLFSLTILVNPNQLPSFTFPYRQCSPLSAGNKLTFVAVIPGEG